MRIKSICLILCFFLGGKVLIGQSIVKNINTIGTCRLGETETLENAKKRALNIAFENALLKGGVSIELNSVYREYNYTINGKSNLSQIWELQSSYIEGNIMDYDSIIYSANEFDISARLIGAKVIKYDKKNDSSFFFDVKNLKDTYYDNEPISFTVTPSQNGYLKIFVLNEKESVLLYPYKHPISDYLNDTKNYLFKAGKSVVFPIHDAYKPGYSIELGEGIKIENSLMVFVFTKDNFNWVADVNSKAIYSIIAKISPDRRTVKYFPIVLKAAKN